MINWYLKVVRDNYANFSGRASRSEYWWFYLANIIISIILNVVGLTIKFPLLATVYGLGVLVPGIAVGVRRMHDVGKSGWFLLIPIYNLILACTAGTLGENEYGPDPLNDLPDFDFDKKDVIS